jgi:hypothetical protein
LASKFFFFEKIGLGFGGLNDVKIEFAGLSLGHDFRQQAFADGAKHGRLDE